MTLPEPEAIVPVGDPATKRRAGAFRRLLTKPVGAASLFVLVALALLAMLEPVLSTHNPAFTSLAHVNVPPGTPEWPLGADQNGRDIWARTLASLQVSFISALIGASMAIVIGSILGLIAGYAGNKTDAVISWVFNLLMTFPVLVLVMVLYPVMGSSYQGMMAVFGFFLSPSIFRLVRNLVVSVRNELYVDAAKVSGLSNWRILSRHVFYAVRGPVIIASAFMASAAIGVQAGLAFLGFGSSTTPSFGAMTSDAFLNIYTRPVQMLWPALFLGLLSGGLVLLGNAYRDVLAAPTAVAKKRAMREAVTAEEALDKPPTPLTDAKKGGLLAVRNLWVRYPQPDGDAKAVVRGVSLDVAPGEIVGLVGESGSGKTQTAFSVLGLLPKEARVSADIMEIAGESLLSKDREAMRKVRAGVVSYIPQEPMANLDPSFTVGSQLVEPLLDRMSVKEAQQVILGLLDRVGIVDPQRTFRSYPHQISGGMAQRVLIAGAVASRPKLLIADEPTTALDVTVQAEILDLLRDLQNEYGIGVLLVTHNFGVVADLCDRVMVMRDGELVESGEVRQIFHAPSHAYTKTLIGSILDEDTVRGDLVPTPAHAAPMEDQ
ncbi:dipeptide/oligopeptide/nickel ABC transporter permease/ATP-binding protein [Arthrobacter sp. NQ7]|uniref:dipeptide/oligopeptide/nickel ABC transporter permease/ATP-binding protein n=1 Tax=Arthrobacter sp. NQ7 TaxID=3032303 RepID=UPI00240F22B2|nr:dipeptide/oligopeptide/nickel ABC transporter permease/ATP-binding protein [Arthrobacter sp. NQ7]MDJ0458651.1 dipeptide/oligopeptide/nickel ABC transporter permease/ATP-binding protein [Arthrobacter sp. NQ7]